MDLITPEGAENPFPCLRDVRCVMADDGQALKEALETFVLADQ